MPSHPKSPVAACQRLLCLLLAACLAILHPAVSGMAHAFTVGEEKELGEKLLSVVRKEFHLLDDPDISQYINKLGRQILVVAGPQFFNYHFFVINNKEFNAFAAPSGLLFFHSGLIELTGSESELVSVMAHEIGHAASRHYADRLNKSKKLNAGTTALMLAGIAMGAGPLAQALISGSMATSATMSLKFSRQDEEEADRLAYKWMRAEGRNPEAMVKMLRSMRTVSRYRQGKLPPYLLTHPAPEQRLIYIEDRLLTDRHPHYPKEDEFEFLRFKYRVLTLTKKPYILLPQFMNKVEKENGQTLENFMAHFGLAQIYLINRSYQKAEEEMRKVIARFPDRPILRTDLGVIYFESGQYDKALRTFNQAAKSAPQDAYTLFNQAKTLQQAGRKTKALAIYQKLLRVIPDFSRLHYYIGQIEASQGDRHAGHYHLGVYYWQEGDVKTARFHLHESMKGLPEGNTLKRKSQELLAKIKRLEKM